MSDADDTTDTCNAESVQAAACCLLKVPVGEFSESKASCVRPLVAPILKQAPAKRRECFRVRYLHFPLLVICFMTILTVLVQPSDSDSCHRTH